MGARIAIIGAGFAGIGAGTEIVSRGGTAVVFEQNATYGGLCGGFTVGGFHFDQAVHLSFTTHPLCQKYFFAIPHLSHAPEAVNYKEGAWVRHPVMSNLRGLPAEERVKIIEGVLACTGVHNHIESYRDWLRMQFGEYFSKNYPERYTEKYWGTSAEKLGITWCSGRIYQPDIHEILLGSYPDADVMPNVYYAKKMRYPKSGGYRAFIEPLAKRLDIRYGYKVARIDIEAKRLYFTNGESFLYDRLISTMPLSEIALLVTSDVTVHEAAQKLQATSMALVSVGFRKKIPFPALWFYVYDKDIPFARVHSPSWKSSENAPRGKCSLQFEVYYSKERPLLLDDRALKERILFCMEEMGLAQRQDVEVVDCRRVKYANVIFYQGMGKYRDFVRGAVRKAGIITCGRFGRWEYLWSDQSFLSGIEAGKCAAAKEIE